jgi:D-alanine-D-alanine ligase-like ATP-grasp enzyme
MYITDDPHASYKLIRDQLGALGYTASEFVTHGHRYIELTSEDGKSWVTPAATIAYPMATREYVEVSRDKAKSYELAAKLGINIPKTYVIDSEHQLAETELDVMLGAHQKLIVKPLRASLSRGLTLSITTRTQLREAIRAARAHHESVLVQEQIDGEELRFIVVGGEVVGALLRQTPRVTGDGVHTVAQLIEKENDQRRAVITPYVTYPLLTKDIIAEEYMTSTEVLPKGQLLELSRATMIKNGCSVYNVTNQVHDDYIQFVKRFAAAADIKFGCVDIFIKDYRKAATASNYWFMEVNTSPVLKLCYGVREGEQLDIAPILAKEIDTYLTSQHYPPVLGIIEYVHIPEFGVYRVEAKVDTGAYSGALHCSTIKVVKRKDGTKVLRFSPSDTGEIQETTAYKEVYVRSASGHQQKRYIVETNIVLRGRKYPITIGLSNRKEMQKEILIGRRFLREHGILVDVRINQELDNDGGGK